MKDINQLYFYIKAFQASKFSLNTFDMRVVKQEIIATSY